MHLVGQPHKHDHAPPVMTQADLLAVVRAIVEPLSNATQVKSIETPGPKGDKGEKGEKGDKGDAAETLEGFVTQDDPRLSDPRPPIPHGHDVEDITDAVAMDDARLSDARPPVSHTHTRSQITDFTHGHAPSEITGTAVVNNDARLSDARAPLTHTHTKSQITDFAHTHPVSEITGLIGGSGYRTLVTLSADVSSAATLNFADITGLSFPVLLGVNYRFYALIAYTASAATIGLRVALTAPASTILAYTTRTSLGATGSASNQWVNAASTVDTGTVSTSSASTTGNLVSVEGFIRPSVAGTVQLRFAPETATAGGIVIKAGSTLEYW